MLGKKLQVRSESRTLKNSRLDSGRIDKRLIAELSLVIQKFSKLLSLITTMTLLNVSVDGGSMGGDKWKNTMTAQLRFVKL